MMLISVIEMLKIYILALAMPIREMEISINQPGSHSV